MWGAKKHELVSAGMTFEPLCGKSGALTGVCVTSWYQCQCGKTYGTQLTCECDSGEEVENLVSGLMSAAVAVCSRTSSLAPLQPSSTDLCSSLMRIVRRLSEE